MSHDECGGEISKNCESKFSKKGSEVLCNKAKHINKVNIEY